MINVFLADDHIIVRDGLRKHINEQFDMKVVGEAGDGLEVLDRASRETWDLIILDLSLPGCSGIELLPKLRALKPELKVVVLSMYPESQYASHVFRHGASAYLSKGRAPAEILDVLRRVARGLKVVAAESATPWLPMNAPLHDRLSPREREILLLLAHGRSPTEIASELELSATTVSTYFVRIRDKLGVNSNTEAVLYAHREHLIE